MTQLDLAKLLVDSPREQRLGMIRAADPLSAVELAESLRQMCYEVWTADPQRVSAIVETLNDIEDITQNHEVRAYAEWASAIEALVAGDLSACIERIDLSESSFDRIGKPHLAAKTQTSKLYALALLGRYDEAVSCGLDALAVFVAHDDQYSAGKIEHNIGNLYWRRDLYRESEPYLASAHRRFTEIGDERQLAMVENCQAFVKTLQNQFRDAEVIYERALQRANRNDLVVTAAEIETGLSNLYLFEGKYDLALKLMERSRQKYEQIEMANQSAVCELEIADIYLELSLLPEAIGFYERAETHFADLGMQSELGRSCLNHARALLRRHDPNLAAVLLDRAEELYCKEGNRVAIAAVRLARSQMMSDNGELVAAERMAEAATAEFAAAENVRFELFARWLRADILRRLDNPAAAGTQLRETLARAKDVSVQAEYLCQVSLGRLTGEKAHFLAAIDLVENSRAMLASDDLRTSFFADRMVPYDELLKIEMSQGNFREALIWHERSRSRTLIDQVQQRSDEPQTNGKLQEIREELDWLHNRINRSPASTAEDRNRIDALRKLALERERDHAELSRRLRSDRGGISAAAVEIDVDEFRSGLKDTTVVEFAFIDGRLTAFVISKDIFTAVAGYADEADLGREINGFLFQIKTGRIIDRLSESNRDRAVDRLRQHSQRLHEMILGPLRGLIGTERLVFVPAGSLHYLPFQALMDGEKFLAEIAEISYAPSLTMLDRCLRKPPADRSSILLVGVADEVTPMVENEIENVARHFTRSRCLLGPDATIENMQAAAAGCGVVHIACHGKFRPDNPVFSSLTLFAEELSVNKIYQFQLESAIITLSACESGLNDVVRGEELIGLTRAFFAAGASTLLLSLWRVSDDATLGLMNKLYAEFCGGLGLSESLRKAQRSLIGSELHPYFWAPFIVSGKW